MRPSPFGPRLPVQNGPVSSEGCGIQLPVVSGVVTLLLLLVEGDLSSVEESTASSVTSPKKSSLVSPLSGSSISELMASVMHVSRRRLRPASVS